MKKYALFIGIDISKSWIDVSLTQDGIKEQMVHRRFANRSKSFKKMNVWIGQLANANQISKDQWLFSMEHTGIYTFPLSLFLEEQGLDYVLESALRINKSTGLRRAKNDQADSKDIARYACLFNKELKTSNLPSKSIMDLKNLMAYRDRLIKQRNALNVPVKEAKKMMGDYFLEHISDSTQQLVELYAKQIREAEKQIKAIIQANESLKKLYNLATSVKGIGMICAVGMIIHTRGFEAFEEHRKFACYISIAPFAKQSGSGMNLPAKVSPLGHKKIKADLTNAAYSAIQHNKQIKAYYERKLKEGKNKYCVLNAVKNKLVSYVFATVKRGTPFVETLNYT